QIKAILASGCPARTLRSTYSSSQSSGPEGRHLSVELFIESASPDFSYNKYGNVRPQSIDPAMDSLSFRVSRFAYESLNHIPGSSAPLKSSDGLTSQSLSPTASYS